MTRCFASEEQGRCSNCLIVAIAGAGIAAIAGAGIAAIAGAGIAAGIAPAKGMHVDRER